jgi:hypothetical protein
MKHYALCTSLVLMLFAGSGCGGGPATGMPSAAALENAPAGPPPGAGAVAPKRSMVKNGARPAAGGPPRTSSRL